jgi:uncharacterized protein YndB with AHSA1/START domain
MTTPPTNPNRIEKQIILRAATPRVWRALTDSREFGAWFGATFDEPFEVGKTITGRITSPGYEHLTMAVIVERMEPERLFSYRWHPYAIDPAVDYSNEPTTLVEFRLEPSGEGTRLTLVESGFDRIPANRRAEAFRMNDQGWSAQMEHIRRHVES